jgi:hypothetical protein
MRPPPPPSRPRCRRIRPSPARHRLNKPTAPVASRPPGRYSVRAVGPYFRAVLRFLTCLLGLLPALPAAAQQFDIPLGAAPVGLHWQQLPEARAAMLLPDGWYYKSEGEKGDKTYFLTGDEIGDSGEFQTGATLHVVRRVKARTRRPAATYAQDLMLRAGFGRHQQQLAKSTATTGAFQQHMVRYRETPPEAEPRVVYQLALANTRTDTLYLLTFESLEKDWPAAWQLGEQMVQRLVLDSHL